MIRWRHYLRAWNPPVDAGVDEELQFHIDSRVEALVAEGRSVDQARAQAIAEFGDVSGVRGHLVSIDRRIARTQRRHGWWHALAADVRLAARSLIRTPAFSIAAILTLALGVGMNSVIVGAIDTVLLRPLPYGHPDRLVSLWETDPVAGRRAGGTNSYANLLDLQDQNASFAGVAAFQLSPQNVVGSATPRRIWVNRVTANFFSVLDVAPVQGRAFLPDEKQPGRHLVAVVSDRYWRELGQPRLLHSTIRLDDVPYEIVGVLPAGFQAPNDYGRSEPSSIFVPLTETPADRSPDRRGTHTLDAVARLRPGMSIPAAQQTLSGIYAGFAKAYPDSNDRRDAGIAPLREDLVRNVRTSLLILAGAVGMLWLVSCVNLANLLLVRAAGRQSEITLRVALGAGRSHIIQMLVTHSALVAMLGCVAGLALGGVLSRFLVLVAPTGIPRLDSMSIEPRAFAFLAALSLLAGIVFGLIPAWQVSSPALADALRSSERKLVGRSVLRWRNALVVAEIALSIVLLTGAGLLLRSFIRLEAVDLGFATDRVVTMNINLPAARYGSAEHRLRFFEALTSRIRVLPGVEAVGFANRFPMRGGWSGSVIVGDPNEPVEVDLQAVSPGYFSTLGIPVVGGRAFDASDREAAPPVAVVNTAFANAYFPGRDPVGRQIRRNLASEPITIVGVVGDVRRAGKDATIQPGLYYPAAQTSLYPVALADLAVRSANDPATLIPAIRGAVESIDPAQPIGNVRTLDELISESVAQRRFDMMLITVFAAAALALTVVGIYGVVSYSVSQRITEFGVRTALGATRGHILGIVLGHAGVLVAMGLGLGLAGSLLLARTLTTMLFEVPPYDPLTFTGVALLLTIVAMASSYLPARRAAATPPATALRDH